MKPKILKKLKSVVRNSIKYVILEVFKGDPQEQIFYSVPGYEGAPVNDEKCISIPTDKNAKPAAIGVVLKTDIPDGETRISGRTEGGIVKCQLHLKSDGTVEIGLKTFNALVKENFITLFNQHIHSVNVPSAVTLPPTVPVTASTVVTTKLKAT